VWTHRHLLGASELSAADARLVFERAAHYLSFLNGEKRISDELRGKVVVHLFFEASTRTRASFEMATKLLGGEVVNLNPKSSSVTKGESLLDTLKNIEAMRANAIVTRHQSSGAPHFMAGRSRIPIVNAGDGLHQHPTQALLDAFTITRKKRRIEGLMVAICGDILHSRVARSNAALLGALGAKVRLVAPRTMMPEGAESLGPTVTVHHDFMEGISGVDVVMMLRVQNERLQGAMMSSPRELAKTFGLNVDKLKAAKPDCLVMHPGPINWGVELTTGVQALGDRVIILDQVESGVAVRMAVLSLLLQGPGANA
jgi:aspartate carbamoyltransferase catalytic subunit